MEPEGLGFFARLWLSFLMPWKVLLDGVFAAKVQRLLVGDARPALDTVAPPVAPVGAGSDERVEAVATEKKAPVREAVGPTPIEPEPVEPEPLLPPGTDPTTALQLLGILQREGRFVDFLQEDVTDFSDADIGAAARVVHAGCKRGLAEYLEVRPIRAEAEGDAVVLEEGFDAIRIRLTGNVAGQPPYRGHLAHHGWEVAEIKLPTVIAGHDPRVVAPAEVEL